MFDYSSKSAKKKEISLLIMTPLGHQIRRKINYIQFPGDSGSFGIKYNHLPLIGLLEPGILHFFNIEDSESNSESQKVENLGITGGYVELSANTIVVLAEEIIEASDITQEFREKYRGLPSYKVKRDKFGSKEQNLARFHLLAATQ
ncbi:FoF1 ATP synthase subunit delta/epsilon [Candidatus Riflebacteria bacterium]